MAWQALNFTLARGRELDPAYALPGATTATPEYLRQFFYTYKHLGLFPVAVLRPGTGTSVEVARRNLRAGGREVVNEITNEVRRGDHGRVWMLWPAAWLRGNAEGAEPNIAKMLAQLVAVLSLYLGGVAAGRPWLGFVLAVLFGSNPFQFAHTVESGRVLGIVLATWAIVTGINLPLLLRPGLRAGTALSIAVASGALLTFAREIRSDVVALLPFLIGAYALAPLAKRLRVALPLTLLAVYLTGAAALGIYWQLKFDDAIATVKRVGGTPFPEGPFQRHHELWHPIATGLGDFDETYGFVWNDTAIFSRVMPALQASLPSPLPYSGGYYFDTYYHGHPLYPVRPSDFPEYHRLVRELVVDRILADPLWYATILLQRIARILTEVTPLALRVGGSAEIPLPGWLWLIPVLIALCLRRRIGELSTLLLGFAPSLTALLVYSGGGFCYFSVYHLVAAALAIEWGGGALRDKVSVAQWSRE